MDKPVTGTLGSLHTLADQTLTSGAELFRKAG
jgi:hypothetical protein